MLPYHGYQNQDGSESGGCQGNLRDRPRREGFNFTIATIIIMLFMPAWKGEEEADGYKRKRNGSNTKEHEVISRYGEVQVSLRKGNTHAIHMKCARITYISPLKTIPSLNFAWTQIRFSGS